MRILLISQAFWPDTASIAQHLSDMADEFSAGGHSVTVFCSKYSYEDPKVAYPKEEVHNNIHIFRIANTKFGKKGTLTRLADFFSFNFLLFFRLLRIKKRSYDMMFCLTAPPLVPFIGIITAKWKKIKFCYWAMDLQPELAIASGLLKKNSLAASFFTRIGNHVIRNSDKIIVLDKYMKAHFLKRGADDKKMTVIPVWPVIEQQYNGSRLENHFRIENGFGNKIVVMYSGNHAYVHPLDTLLQSILLLKNDPRFLFVFIGGGMRKKDVTEFKNKHELPAIVQLPYQPRNLIHYSLGSADLQVVILGDGQVGFTHPNKIYGAMFLGKPVLYIGPDQTHVTDILRQCPGNIMVQHGQSSQLAHDLILFAENADRDAPGRFNYDFAQQHFAPAVLRAEMMEFMLQ